MDNFFTGAAFLRYLATKEVFAVGALRGTHTGVELANHLRAKSGMTATKAGHMLAARPHELVIIKCIDSHQVYLMSKKHVLWDELEPDAYYE